MIDSKIGSLMYTAKEKFENKTYKKIAQMLLVSGQKPTENVTERLSEDVCVNNIKTTDYSSNSGTELHKLELLLKY